MARRARVLLALSLMAGCSRTPPGEQAEQTRTIGTSEGSIRGNLTLAVTPGTISWPHVAGNDVRGLSGGVEALDAATSASFIAALAPVAVPDPERRFLAYNALDGKTPLVRIRDLRRHQEVVLERGAFSPAWRTDGALAYFRNSRPEVNIAAGDRPVGHVVVRRSLQDRAVRWSRETGHFVVAAWTAAGVLAYRIGNRWPDLLLIEGPGRERELAAESGLVALSPDGRLALVTSYGASPPVVRLLDVTAGEEVGRHVFGGDVSWLAEAGSWVGDRAVVKASIGLVVLRVGHGGVAFEQVLRFEDSEFPLGAFEPQMDDAAQRISFWAELTARPRQALSGVVFVECDRVALRCFSTRPFSAALAPRFVHNPSRPQ